MADRQHRSYSNGEITVLWQPEKCRHSGICVSRLPEVFDARSRPWINMEAAESRKIVETILRCPSGALSYTLGGTRKPQAAAAPPRELVTR